jgi:hypothetical protein
LVSSTPLVIYFLAFINFFTTSSLYVLLNFPVPEHVHNYISAIYDSLNMNILTLLGISPHLKSISQEKVNRSKPLHFGVSSDMPSSNADIVFTVLTNLFFLTCLHFCFSLVKKSNKLRLFFDSNKYDLIYGQITNTLVPITLPWVFVLK